MVPNDEDPILDTPGVNTGTSNAFSISIPGSSPTAAAASPISGPSKSTPEPIPAVPSPWTLHGDIYLFSWWTSGSQAKKGLPSHAYSPLEARSEYAGPSSGKHVGGLSMIQILRYKDSPVGPYDELIVIPGSFDYSREDASGKKEVRRSPRISRIYVSQKHTCYNGRINWNVPKHLAHFEWTDNPDGSTAVKVFPHDTDPADQLETKPSSVPFFQATFKPLRFTPSFPLATTWVNYLGIDSTLVMPPLPEGSGSQGELPGTNRWAKIVPEQYSRNTKMGWFDIAQHRDEDGKLATEYENFWPGLGRWQFGAKMENAIVGFNECEETWEPPRARL